MGKMPCPKKVMKNLDDLHAQIPPGGLLDPKLRKGFGENFNVEKIRKSLFGNKAVRF